jgi:hypothetical protein
MMQDLAGSAGAIAWLIADDDGLILWLEDPADRPANRQFVIDIDGHVTIGSASLDPDIARWTTADLLQDPLTFTSDPTQAITSVDVSWQEELIGDEGEVTFTEHTVTRTDTGAAQRLGLRRLHISTELVSERDASDLAFKWLAQCRTAEWFGSNMTIDTAVLTRPLPGVNDEDRLTLIMDLLSVQQRCGQLITIEDLPEWTPTVSQSYYIEGGTYRWERDRWRFDLAASTNALGGGARWMDMPGWRGESTPEIEWSDMDESITWVAAYGVAAPQ